MAINRFPAVPPEVCGGQNEVAIAPPTTPRRSALRSFLGATLSTLSVLGSVVGTGLAVEPGEPSKTSIRVTVMRALAARDFDPTVRGPDWLAEQFLGPVERRILAGEPLLEALGKDYREAGNIDNGIVGVVMVRTKYIDEALLEALAREGDTGRNTRGWIRQPRLSIETPVKGPDGI